jgi:hypothetical protein
MKRVGSQIFVKLLSVKRYLKHIIAARVLFKNYLSAFILYLLWRRRLLEASKIRVICRDGYELILSPELYGVILGALTSNIIKRIVYIHSKVITATSIVLPITEDEATYLNALRLS